MYFIFFHNIVNLYFALQNKCFAICKYNDKRRNLEPITTLVVFQSHFRLLTFSYTSKF